MTFDGTYYFEGIKRLDLGLGSPNCTGAVIAELLIISWLFGLTEKEGATIRKIVSFVGEAVGFGLLSITYSRGALLAYAAGIGFVAYIVRGRVSGKLLSGRIAMSLLIIAVSLALSGFYRRVLPGYVGQDASILNRISLWRSSLAILSSGGLTHLGFGGRSFHEVYTNWFQPCSIDLKYYSPVCTYLRVLIDIGWLGGTCAFIAIVMILKAGALVVKNASRIDTWVIGALAVLVVWLVASIFSSFESCYSLIVLPGLSLCFIVWRFSCVATRKMFTQCVLGGVVWGTFSIGLVRIAVYVCDDGMCREFAGDGAVRIWRNKADVGVTVRVVGDQLVLGVYPGRVVRSLLDRNLRIREIEFITSGRCLERKEKVDITVIVGSGVLNPMFYSSSENVLVNPDVKIVSVDPSNTAGKVSCVFIGELSDLSYRVRLQRWAVANGLSLKYVAQCRTDMTLSFVDIVDEILKRNSI